jgi:hypothetical protein
MTTISDDDIFNNLKLLKEKVDGINIKTKETILTTSETKEDIISSIKPYVLYFIYSTPVIISASIIYLLIQIKSDIIMTETKIDNFLTKTEISYYKVSFISLIICFVIYFIIFLSRKKLNQLFTIIPNNPK